MFLRNWWCAHLGDVTHFTQIHQYMNMSYVRQVKEKFSVGEKFVKPKKMYTKFGDWKNCVTWKRSKKNWCWKFSMLEKNRKNEGKMF